MEPVRQIAELLSRIRTALRGRTAAEPGLPYVFPRDPAASPGVAETVDRFRERFERHGGIFLAGDPVERVLDALGERLRVEGVGALFCPEDDAAARSVADTLVPYGPFLLLSPAHVRQTDLPVTAGIQTAEFGIGETGTIVQTSRDGKTLLPGIASDVHVSLLSPGRILPGMEDCLDALSGDPPRNISLITGPSRTADIELTLTVGVHGPRKVIVVLLP